jgi:hypothetical protein
MVDANWNRIERPKELARQKKTISEAFVEGKTRTVLEVAYRSAQGIPR